MFGQRRIPDDGSLNSYGETIMGAFGLISIIYLWEIQVNVDVNTTVPVYFFYSIILLLFSKSIFKFFPTFAILLLLLLAIFALQIMQSGFVVELKRTFFGLIAISFMVPATLVWFQACQRDSFRLFFSMSKIIIAINILLQLSQALDIIEWNNREHAGYIFNIDREPGIMSEPSFLALMFSPLIYLLVCHFSYLRRVLGMPWIILMLFSMLFGASTTLVVVFLAAALVNLMIRYKNWLDFALRTVVFTVIFGAAFFLFGNISEMNDRLLTVILLFTEGIFDSINNISAMIFFKTAEMAFNGIKNFPLGVGILNFQLLAPLSAVSDLSLALSLWNAMGGGSFLLKVVGELGLVGLLISLFSVKYLIKFSINRSIDTAVVSAFIFSFLVTLIRGSSYFDGPHLIGFAIVVGLLLRLNFSQQIRNALVDEGRLMTTSEQ